MKEHKVWSAFTEEDTKHTSAYVYKTVNTSWFKMNFLILLSHFLIIQFLKC